MLIECFIGGSGFPPIDIPIQMQRICWNFILLFAPVSCLSNNHSYSAAVVFKNFVGIISIFHRSSFVSFLISEAKHLR